jgi:hypothetical protein
MTTSSRWLSWTPPRPIGTIGSRSDLSPSEPSKPSFGGLEGLSPSMFPIIEATTPDTIPIASRARAEEALSHVQEHHQLDPLWGDSCRCGAREWRKMAGPMLRCIACGRIATSEYLAKEDGHEFQ